METARLGQLLRQQEGWRLDRVLTTGGAQADAQPVAAPLGEGEASNRSLTEALLAAFDRPDFARELEHATGPGCALLATLGRREARRHLQWNDGSARFARLLQSYRQGFRDLLEASGLGPVQTSASLALVLRSLEHVEQGFAAEWDRQRTSEPPATAADLAALVASEDWDRAFVEEVFGLFLRKQAEYLAAGRAALESRDLGAVADAAHRLRSAVGIFRVRRAAEDAREAEQAARGSGAELADRWERLEQSVTALAEVLRRYLATP